MFSKHFIIFTNSFWFVIGDVGIFWMEVMVTLGLETKFEASKTYLV